MENTELEAMQNEWKPEGFFRAIPPERKAQLLDNALAMIADLYEGEEQYNMLRFSLGLTEEETKLLGFDQYMYDGQSVTGRNTKHRRVLFVPSQMMKVINGYLHAESEDEYQDKDVIIRYGIKFSDGIEMDIKCCGCQDGPSFAEAVLYSYGSEAAHSDASDTFEQVWELSHGKSTYIVEVMEI